MIARIDSVFLLSSENEIDKKVRADKVAADTDVRLDDDKSEIII